jgi:prophage DNA circulation protein
VSFLDSLLDASLDGVPFLYRSASTPVGRRTVVYEFPNRDEPFVEDLGRRARRWSIEAFVLEPDYFSKRDALIKVLEKGGIHTLIHPYRGEHQVRVEGPITVTESSREGGMASFPLTLVEAGTADEILRIEDTASRVRSAADRTLSSLSENSKLGILDAIQDVVQAAINGIENANSALRRVRGKIAAKMNTIESLTQAINSFEDNLSSLLNTPQALINQFSALVASVLNLVNTAAGIGDTAPENTIPRDFDRPSVLMDAFRDTVDFAVDAEEPPDTTPQRVQESENQDAIEEMVKVAMIAETCRNLVDLEFESSDQTIGIRDELTSAFEGLTTDENTEDPLFEALEDLRTGIVNHMQTVAQELPSISRITPPIAVPALVLAYNLYDDAGQDLDIVARNNVANPGFVPGGVELEVLSSAT